MDTKEKKLDVSDKLNDIKRLMPETYRAIQAKAAAIGNRAYELVRRGLRGEPNCFYAIEGGRVVGAPYTLDVQADVAATMVRWGCTYVCIFNDAKGA